MEELKSIVNEALTRIFNQIMMNEEAKLQLLVGKDISIRDIHIIEASAQANLENNATSGAIAKKLGITPGTLTVAITKLEKKGYIKRTPSQEDKRFVTISLTKNGEAVNTAHTNFHIDMTNKICHGLKGKEEKQLYHLLVKVKDFFD